MGMIGRSMRDIMVGALILMRHRGKQMTRMADGSRSRSRVSRVPRHRARWDDRVAGMKSVTITMSVVIRRR